MLHVIITKVRTRRRAGQQLIAFLYRRAGVVRLSKAPFVYVDGTRRDAEDLCRRRGWKVEHVRGAAKLTAITLVILAGFAWAGHA